MGWRLSHHQCSATGVLSVHSHPDGRIWVVMCMKRLEQGIQWYPLTICWRGGGTGILLRTQATPVFFFICVTFRMLLAGLQIAEQT